MSRGARVWYRSPMADSQRLRRRLTAAYSFPGFRALATVRGEFGKPQIRVITLVRRSKKRSAAVAGAFTMAGTTGRFGVSAICPVASGTYIWRSRCTGWRAGVAGS